mgnify:CR=1 FL=1
MNFLRALILFVLGSATLLQVVACNSADDQVTPFSDDIMFAEADQIPPQGTTIDAGFDSEFGFAEEDEGIVDDPLEPWNRFWFEVNDAAYSYALNPLAKGYRYVVPDELRRGVRNFFHNLLFPVRFVNCILQGKFLAAGVEFSRFVGNTMYGFGFLGHFNDAKGIVEVTDDEDFGQTLAVWGFGNGFYVVWPLLGPSTLRDTIGMLGDSALSPVTYVSPWYASTAASAYARFNTLSFHIDEYDALKSAAFEPYSAFRNGYIQLRNEQTRE